MKTMLLGLSLLPLALWTAPARGGPPLRVSDSEQLQQALRRVRPGETIALARGRYRGGVFARDLQGEPGKPIILTAADPTQPPVFEGGSEALHFSNVSYLEIRHLVVTRASGNGLNIDHGGSPETSSHHVVIRNLVVRDIGPRGNHDGIKLSGVDEFRVEDCTLERWGSDGSGIDMVGCRRGVVAGCTFRHGDAVGSNGVQVKGGSTEVAIRCCRFEHSGQRAVNLGGSTGLAFFRPRPLGYEARDVSVEDCTFLGSTAAVAFVGVDRAVVRHNTIYRPRRWVFRILQETRAPGFVPCRGGRVSDNLIAFRSDELAAPINVGDATDPQSFVLARNAWYCLDAPGRSTPRLEIPETDGLHGVDPRFRDPGQGDLRTASPSTVRAAGARDCPHPSREGRQP